MSGRLSGKVCVITGTGGSVGRAAALSCSWCCTAVPSPDLMASARCTVARAATTDPRPAVAETRAPCVAAARPCCPTTSSSPGTRGRTDAQASRDPHSTALAAVRT